MYRINLVALSSSPGFDDSPMSNTLTINVDNDAVLVDKRHFEDYSTTDNDLSVNVSGVTDSCIHLDWSNFMDNNEVAFYKIQWSSTAQPMVSSLQLIYEKCFTLKM